MKDATSRGALQLGGALLLCAMLVFWARIAVADCTLTVDVYGEGQVDLDLNGGVYPEGTSVSLAATAEPNYHFDRWEISTGTAESLRAVWGFEHGVGFIVGSNGTLLTADDPNTWKVRAMDSGTTARLTDVWGTGPNDVFVVGHDATIVHYDGSTWLPMSVPDFTDWRGVWGTGPNDVFAVGDGDMGDASILHYDGSSWSAVTDVTDQALWDVWVSAPNNVFVVGAAGTIFHYDGTAWTAMDSGTPATLFGVLGRDGADWGGFYGDVVAVGQQGVVRSYYNGEWVGLLTSEYNPLNVTLETDWAVMAVFEPDVRHSLIVYGGSGSGTYRHGEEPTIKAMVPEGKGFVAWTGDTDNVADVNAAETTVIVKADTELTATFEDVPGTYTLTVNIVGPGTVMRTPDKPDYPQAEQVALKAIPLEECDCFLGWQGADDANSTSLEITVTMDSNKVITASFYDGKMSPATCCAPGACEASLLGLGATLLVRLRRRKL